MVDVGLVNDWIPVGGKRQDDKIYKKTQKVFHGENNLEDDVGAYMQEWDVRNGKQTCGRNRRRSRN